MKPVKSIILQRKIEPGVISLVNQYAALCDLKPTTALKQYLLLHLPAEIDKRKNQKNNQAAEAI